MRVYLLFIFTLLFNAYAAQAQQGPSSNNTGNVYALVVGIANYQDKEIPQLQYSNRDAEVFADYLKSKAGGSVPPENIQLLVDSAATTGAVYDAIYWLSKTCQKGDLVFFYFSGHGDLENTTMFKNGFLICYDSPPTNYVKLSLSVDYLSDIAYTLSAQTLANVVLITDACHSGKLAGSSKRGTFLVSEQLRAIRDKEIRITSSADNQLSNENEAWGGGRGVFSYYLVNGLKGLADNSKDGIVTLDEIKSYLDVSFNKDDVLKKENIIQTPVLKGRGDFQLAKVDADTRKETEKVIVTMVSPISNATNTIKEVLPADAQDYFFLRLKKEGIEVLTNYLKLNELPVADIPFALIQIIKDLTETQEEIDKLSELENKLRQSQPALLRFNGKLAVAFDRAGQQVINQYLKGDEAELERRRYYNITNNGYDIYPKMFQVALKLVAPDNEWHKILEVKLHYFTGVAIRLKVPTVENAAPLIEQALAEQLKALAMEDRAAYIYNELGVLYLEKNEPKIAEKYFLKAVERAGEWVVPWSNLAGVYANNKNFEKGFEAANKAKALRPDLQGIYVNTGYLYQQKGDLLQAEELYRKSIKINSRHYLPFENLGTVCMNTTQYTLADSFFYEADIRKKGYHFKPDVHIKIEPMFFVYPPQPPCPVDPKDVGKNDIMGHFALGMIAYNDHKFDTAESEFKKVIALDKTNPLAFHYLGKLLYEQKRWEEGDIIFNLATRYHLTDTAFDRYVDSLSAFLPATTSKECIINQFKWKHYAKIEDHYFLGTLYEFWNHYTEAEAQYRKIIELDRIFIGGYNKLWSLMEKLARYKDAESAVLYFLSSTSDKSLAKNELSAFYDRMVERFPDDGDWNYTAGLFNYHLAADAPDDYPRDKKIIQPDTYEEKFVFIPDYNDHEHSLLSMPGTLETKDYSPEVTLPRNKGIKYLLKADSLLALDDDAIVDINDKIGDLYVWQGLTYRSIPHYEKALSFKADNAGIRLKLVDGYNEIYQYQAALTELDSLNRRNEINFPKQLLLAKYLIHSGKFTEAQSQLTGAEKIHPYKMPEVIDLNGRLQLLSGHPAEALKFYQQLLVTNKNDSNIIYNIARLYAKTGNINEAWHWLDVSLKKGFNFSFVLQFDPYLEVLRRSTKWNSLLSGYTMKKYPAPKESIKTN